MILRGTPTVEGVSMKVILERKGFSYLGLKDKFHTFKSPYGDIILTESAKFVDKQGRVWFCNKGKPIEGRRETKSAS
jgi:hypothetical protein